MSVERTGGSVAALFLPATPRELNANSRFRVQGFHDSFGESCRDSIVGVMPKSELEMGMLLDEPSPPVNFAASRTWILVRNSAPAYRWIWFHPTRLCEVGAR